MGMGMTHLRMEKIPTDFFYCCRLVVGLAYWYQYDKHCHEVVLIDCVFLLLRYCSGCFYFYEGRSINYAVPFCNLFMERPSYFIVSLHMFESGNSPVGISWEWE